MRDLKRFGVIALAVATAAGVRFGAIGSSSALLALSIALPATFATLWLVGD